MAASERKDSTPESKTLVQFPLIHTSYGGIGYRMTPAVFLFAISPNGKKLAYYDSNNPEIINILSLEDKKSITLSRSSKITNMAWCNNSNIVFIENFEKLVKYDVDAWVWKESTFGTDGYGAAKPHDLMVIPGDQFITLHGDPASSYIFRWNLTSPQGKGNKCDYYGTLRACITVLNDSEFAYRSSHGEIGILDNEFKLKEGSIFRCDKINNRIMDMNYIHLAAVSPDNIVIDYFEQSSGQHVVGLWNVRKKQLVKELDIPQPYAWDPQYQSISILRFPNDCSRFSLAYFVADEYDVCLSLQQFDTQTGERTYFELLPHASFGSTCLVNPSNSNLILSFRRGDKQGIEEQTSAREVQEALSRNIGPPGVVRIVLGYLGLFAKPPEGKKASHKDQQPKPPEGPQRSPRK